MALTLRELQDRSGIQIDGLVCENFYTSTVRFLRFIPRAETQVHVKDHLSEDIYRWFQDVTRDTYYASQPLEEGMTNYVDYSEVDPQVILDTYVDL